VLWLVVILLRLSNYLMVALECKAFIMLAQLFIGGKPGALFYALLAKPEDSRRARTVLRSLPNKKIRGCCLFYAVFLTVLGGEILKTFCD